MKSKNQIKKERGNRIRGFREGKKLSQAEFAQRIGYSQKFLSAIEVGKAEVSRKFLEKIQEVYDLPVQYVLYGSEEDQETKSMAVQEPKLAYAQNLFDDVKEILESENIDLVNALKANVKAFVGAVRAAREKRRYPRFLLNLPVDVEIMDELEARPGMVVNASQMGLLIQSAYDLPVGKKIDLKVAFQKTAGPENFRAKAEIMWKDKHRLEDTEQFHYGVRLIEVLNEGHAKLESLLRD